MQRKILCSLILLTVIQALINPGISKSSISHIISPKNSNSGLSEKSCRTKRIAQGNSISSKVLNPLQCSSVDPLKETEIVNVANQSLQKGGDIEMDEEATKEGKLNSSYIVLGVLFATFASNQWSRQALYYLCDFSSNSDPFKHINAAVNFNKEQYASLASFGFTAVFASVSIFAGTVSDRFDRNVVMALSCTVWSVSTALQGFATGSKQHIYLNSWSLEEETYSSSLER